LRNVFTDTTKIPALPMYILANLAVGGTWPGAPDSTTTFPSYLDIQSIKVWQSASSTIVPTATSGTLTAYLRRHKLWQ